MKLVQSLVVAAALAMPAVAAFAQSNETAAPVNAQVSQVSAAQDVGGVADGTSASGSHPHLHAFGNDVARLGHKIQGSIRPDANDGMKPIYFGS
jgi:hypothetical protein